MTDLKFNDFKLYRSIFPELTDSQIETVLLSCWSSNDLLIATTKKKHISTIRKQKMLITKKLQTTTFTEVKQIARFRIWVISFGKIFEINHN